MRRMQLLLVLLMIPLIGCAAGGRNGPQSIHTSLSVVSSQEFTAIIVPRLVNYSNSWTPTEDEVLLAEPKVQAFVLSWRPGLKSTLSKYVRHYSGWTLDGKRRLRIQFFDTRSFRAKDLAHPLEVCDGDGETYFVVLFDLASGKCSL